MGLLLEASGLALVEATVAAAAWLLAIALAACRVRQPARRVQIARIGVLGLLVLLPAITLFPDRPRFPWPGEPLEADSAGEADAVLGPLPLLGWLSLIHGLGAAAGLAWIALGAGVSRWLVSRAVPPDESVAEIYRGLIRGRRVRPRLLVSGKIHRPVLVGCFLPVILIPAAWEERATPLRLRLGFLHELAHAQNGDVAFQLLSRLARAIWFFLPGLPWLIRRLQHDQEILADLHAARQFGDSTRYATTLVDLAASHHRRLSPELGVASAGSHPLSERLSALLIDPRHLEERVPPVWSASAHFLSSAVLAILWGLPLDPLQPLRANPSPTFPFASDDRFVEVHFPAPTTE